MDLSSLTLRWQRFVLLGMVVLTSLVFWTSAPDTFGLPKATILWVGAIVLVGLGLVRAAFDRTIAVPRSPFGSAIAAVVVTVVIATTLSPTLALSVVGEYNRYTGLLSYLAFAVAGLVALRSFDVDEAALLLRIVTVLLAIGGGYVLLQHAGLDPFGLPDTLGYVGTFGNVNLVAGFAAIAVPAATWVALSGTQLHWQRIAAAVLVGVGLLVTVVSKSVQGPAAGVPALLFVVAVWATTDDGKAIAQRIGRRAFVGVAAGVALLVVIGGVAAGPSALRSGLLERGAFWRAALTMFSSHPIAGIGFDTYGQHFLADRPAGHAVRYTFTQAESAHNVPLNLLAGGGVLVGAAWAALLAVTGWALVMGLRRLDGEERLLLGGLGGCWMAYVIQSVVSFDVPELGLLHFVLAGTIVAIAVPPKWTTVRLPGQPADRAVPTSTYVAAAVVTVVGLFAVWHATRPLRADLAAAHAQDQLDEGNSKGALATLASATSLAPWQGRYWLLRAQVSEAASEVFDATDFAATAAEREPGSSQYALLAGRLNAHYRNATAARVWFDQALRRDPHDPLVFAAVAEFEAGAGRAAVAQRLIDRATALAPDLPNTWLAAGAVARAAGDLSGARKAYERALQLSPGLGAAITALGQLDSPPASP